jgi:hypothetical protein
MKNFCALILATTLLFANSVQALAAEKSQLQTEQYITNFVNRYSGCRGEYGGSASIEVKSPNIAYTETSIHKGEAFTRLSKVSINDIVTAEVSPSSSDSCRSYFVLTCIAAAECISVAIDGSVKQRHNLHIGLSASVEDAEKLQRAFDHLSKLNFDVDDF